MYGVFLHEVVFGLRDFSVVSKLLFILLGAHMFEGDAGKGTHMFGLPVLSLSVCS